MQFDKAGDLFSSHFAVTLPSVHPPRQAICVWKAIFLTEDETALKIHLLSIDLGLSQEQMVF